MTPRCLPWLVLVLVPACTLDRRPIPPPFDEDIGVDGGDDAPDVVELDVVEPDTLALDAPADVPDEPDVPPLDAPLDATLDVPPDVRLDVPLDVPPDVPRDAVVCPAVETACDRIDEDCDGTIDDDGVCGGCDAFTLGGRAYLSCPGPVTGAEAWSGACRRLAPGYDLVVFDSAAERDAVRLVLATLARATHWVGLNDFDANGAFVWLDRAAPPPSLTSPDPTRGCVGFESSGFFTEYPCDASHPVLCEARRAPGACGAEAAGCNGTDEDCDGRVDEGIDCGGLACASATFWDSVYWACRAERTATDARSACTAAMGAELATLTSRAEMTAVLGLTVADAWVGLAQDASATSPSGGWTWFVRSSTFGVPASTGGYPWGSGEPNDSPSVEENREEDCGTIRDGDGRLNDASCAASFDFVCERRWSY